MRMTNRERHYKTRYSLVDAGGDLFDDFNARLYVNRITYYPGDTAVLRNFLRDYYRPIPFPPRRPKAKQ